VKRTGHALLFSTALAAWLSFGQALADPAPVLNLGVSAAAPNGAVIVRRGETVSGIAGRYKVSSDGIIKLNGLRPPYALRAGQRLLLPAPREHKVRENDTLFSISRLYGVPLGALATTNNLHEPYVLRTGKVLRIPAASEKPKNFALAAETPRKNTVFVLSAPAQPRPVTLLKNPGPSPEREAFAVMIAKLADEEDRKPPLSSLLQPAVARSPAPALLQDSRRPDFIWPVRGQVVSGYGPKNGGLYNDGINIAAPRGAAVAAAADGTVAYVGDALKSYGNLVLIRHGGGMVTAYAHMNAVTVRAGMQVRRGEPIGSVGSSGNVASAQLHFEVRRGKETLDPQRYLTQS
jgi:murein DD-endopeptidase MepM/ murein hydrolase activator NlpD